MAPHLTEAQSEAQATAEAHWPQPGHLAALAVAGVGGALLLGLAVHSGPTWFDVWLHNFVVAHRGAHHTLARTLTQAGSTKIIWPMVALASLLFPRSRGWRRVATTLAFGGAAALAIGVRLGMSDVFNRPRPPAVDWAGTAGGFAFPSGHTSAATIGAGALGWALVRHLDHRIGRIAIWTAVVVYAGGVGWTRIWLGVHWPLDVLGAWFFGIGWMSGMAAVAIYVERRWPMHHGR
jgi:membrane-associated phospholipid phosphatase